MKYECSLLPIVHFSAEICEARCPVCRLKFSLRADVSMVVCDGYIALVHRDCIPDTALL